MILGIIRILRPRTTRASYHGATPLFEGLPDHNFWFDRKRSLSVVEEIDASFVRLNHQIFRHIVGDLVTERDPREPNDSRKSKKEEALAMYAITVSTGRVGGATAWALLKPGRKFARPCRDQVKAAAWEADGVELVRAPWEDAALAEASCQAEGVYAMAPPTA